MALALRIHPLANDLPMYGEPDPSSAYSLSGHISISVTSPYSLFEARRTARLLLQSVTITFEGQSEIFTPANGYSSLRLCTVTRELAPSTPMVLSNEGHEESSEPCVWNIIFNLPIPGWLPSTNSIGVECVGNSYALYATVKFSAIEDEIPSSYWTLASLCAPFRTRVRTAEARRHITVTRYISAPKADFPQPNTVNYLVNSTPTTPPNEVQDKTRIPPDVLSKIQVLASIPEYVDIRENAMPLTLRLRTKDLCEEECKKLQVTEVIVDVIQQEKCRYRPSSSYLARYPLPSKRLQPPNTPLRNPHPLSSIYDVGLYVSPSHSESVCRTFSLLPPEESGLYTLAPENYVFTYDAASATGASQTWYTMDTSVPFVHSAGGIERWGGHDEAEVEYQGLQWAGEKELRPSTSSPLYSALHELAVSLTCTYDLEGKGGKVATEKLSFKVPVTFARVAPRLGEEEDSSTSSVVSTALPVYSQLYDANGERRIDYSTPLPVYTPRKEKPESESEALLQDQGEDDHAVASSGNGNLSVYHGLNALDGEADKRHTPVVFQDGRTPADAPSL
ncbi:hypothetical protein BDN70DRAFT_797148 [Pholiota conissans]|uniref:Uncharacterized protein n=1 Tax=Pholiota conissans TaxID=109636 RepID=A0A9P5ZBK2_9AGAR|nr:hypothetical protein BDN70DRAFT_797148 [Pholiota conissans]